MLGSKLKVAVLCVVAGALVSGGVADAITPAQAGAIADMRIGVTATPDGVHVGATIKIALKTSNSGPLGADDVFTRLEIPSGLDYVGASGSPGPCTFDSRSRVLRCDDGTVAPGTTIARVVTATAAASGTKVLTASVSSSTLDLDRTNNSATSTVTVVTGSDLSMNVEHSPAQSTVVAGEELTYRFAMTNLGPHKNRALRLDATLPPHFARTGQIQGGTCSFDRYSGHLRCIIDGEAVVNGVRNVYVQGHYITAGSKTVTAKVTGLLADPNTGNNTDSDAIGVTALSSDLSMTVHHPNQTTFVAGKELTYRFAITNHGPHKNYALQLDAALPADFRPTEYKFGTCVFDPTSGTTGHLRCTLDGEAVTNGSRNVYVTGFYITGGSKTVTATATGVVADPNTANNTDSDAIGVTALSSDLTMTVSHTPDQVAAGHELTYRFAVTNNGPHENSDLQLDAILPTDFVPTEYKFGDCVHDPSSGHLRCIIDGEAVTNGSRNVYVTGHYKTGGSKTVTATGTGLLNDPNTANNTDTDTVTVS